MNSSQLNSNYFYACVHHVYATSGSYPTTSNFVDILSRNDVCQITSWNTALANNVAQPTTNQLLAYTLTAITNTYTNWQKYLVSNDLTNINYTQCSNITLSFSGPWDNTQSVNVLYNQTGSVVNLTFPEINILGNGTGNYIQTTTTMPSALTPFITKSAPFISTNNGQNFPCILEVNSSGNIVIYKDVYKNQFDSASGVFGWLGTTIQYKI